MPTCSHGTELTPCAKTGRFSTVCTWMICSSVPPGPPWSCTSRVPISTLGGATRPSASKNCCTAPSPVAAGPCTGYVQPLVTYHAATAPLAKRAAAALGAALAFSAICRGVFAPARTPCPNGVTGTCTPTGISTVPPFVSTTTLPRSGWAPARSALPTTCTVSAVSWRQLKSLLLAPAASPTASHGVSGQLTAPCSSPMPRFSICRMNRRYEPQPSWPRFISSGWTCSLAGVRALFGILSSRSSRARSRSAERAALRAAWARSSRPSAPRKPSK